MSLIAPKPTWHFGNNRPMPFRPTSQTTETSNSSAVTAMPGDQVSSPLSDMPIATTNGDSSDMTLMSHVFILEDTVKQQLSIINEKMATLVLDYEERTGHKIDVAVLEKNVGLALKDETNGEPLIDVSSSATKQIDTHNVLAQIDNDSIKDTAPAAVLATEQFTATTTPSSTAELMPLAIRQLPPLTKQILPQAYEPLPRDGKTLEAFTLNFLTSTLGGSEWSPGLYYPATGGKCSGYETPTPKQLLPKSKTYYVLDASVDSFLPQHPGEHGAKLSVFFRNFEDTRAEKRYQNVPLFVCLDGSFSTSGSANASDKQDASTSIPKQKHYTYMGHYSQKRWSDKLDYDRVQEIVPEHVKVWWANILTSKDTRPEWIEMELMQTLWPKPEYDGMLPGIEAATTTTDVTSETDGTMTAASVGQGQSQGVGDGANGKKVEKQVREDIADYVEELREWEKKARMKVGLLKMENILEAFKREDAAAEPGLRFWWEYLECVAFDRNYYYMLATEKRRRGPTMKGDSSSSSAGKVANAAGSTGFRDPALALDG